MSETSPRNEPIIDLELLPPPERATPPASAPEGAPNLLELLARLEDKTARIEEKLSRSEGSVARVIDRFEASSHRMSEIAQQSELMAVRSETKFIARRVRALPGFTTLLGSSLVTAVLTAILTVLIIRYVPGLVGR